MDLKELSTEQLKEALAGLGQPAFRAKQIARRRLAGAPSFASMTELPASLREELSGLYSWDSLSIELVQKSKDGTRKYLLGLPDGETVEAVFMSYEYGNSLCVSTQVGCNMSCSFCASTIGGKVRDLKAWEILYEYHVISRDAGPINHIVLMGMGEPFDNYEEVASFLRMIHDPDGPGLSYRNVTVSTCGLVPGIDRFTKDFPQVNLAISLHASSQEERESLMPVAKAYRLPELLEACRRHCEATGRRVTFEYALIEGKNDSLKTASDLASLLRGLLCHVNLIPLNPVTGTGLTGSSRERAEAFRQKLEDLGIPATVRRRLGSDIDAACGQLRKSSAKKA